jgi:hypothetical protein
VRRDQSGLLVLFHAIDFRTGSNVTDFPLNQEGGIDAFEYLDRLFGLAEMTRLGNRRGRRPLRFSLMPVFYNLHDEERRKAAV